MADHVLNAELIVNMGDLLIEEENLEILTLETRIILTIAQYKQIFYSNGKNFSLASTYLYPNNSSNIQKSSWVIQDSINYDKFYNLNKLGGLDNFPKNIYLGYQTIYGETWKAQKQLFQNL